jgi:predicted dehydrogenase
VELTGIYDANAESARAVAEKHKLHVFNSIAEAAAASDALNIVTPTTTHFEIAKKLLAQGKHVLVEKPMTDNSAQAGELIELAKKNNCVLQVGHVERFNPVFKYVAGVANDPRYIECQRLSPFPARSMDIGVVLDLMIHDLDIVLALVKSPGDQRGRRGHDRLEQERGHRQRAAAFCQRLRGQHHRQPRERRPPPQNPPLQRPGQSLLHLRRFPVAGRPHQPPRRGFRRGTGAQASSANLATRKFCANLRPLRRPSR